MGRFEIRYPQFRIPGTTRRSARFGGMDMKGEQDCEGSIKFGNLPWDINERLAQFMGNWLEFSSQENALVVRKAEPIGCRPSRASRAKSST